MTEIYNPDSVVSLHALPAFNRIKVGESLELRPLDMADSDRILEIIGSDPQISQNVAVAAKIKNESSLADEIDRYTQDPGLIRYTVLKDHRPIGLISFWRDDGLFGAAPNLDDYGFGYFLDPTNRGQGIIGRSLKTLMETATDNLPVRQFVAFCADDNLASQAVLKRLGLEPTDQTFIEPANKWIERKYIRISGAI